jgi:hypothetical protein
VLDAEEEEVASNDEFVLTHSPPMRILRPLARRWNQVSSVPWQTVRLPRPVAEAPMPRRSNRRLRTCSLLWAHSPTCSHRQIPAMSCLKG